MFPLSYGGTLFLKFHFTMDFSDYKNITDYDYGQITAFLKRVPSSRDVHIPEYIWDACTAYGPHANVVTQVNRLLFRLDFYSRFKQLVYIHPDLDSSMRETFQIVKLGVRSALPDYFKPFSDKILNHPEFKRKEDFTSESFIRFMNDVLWGLGTVVKWGTVMSKPDHRPFFDLDHDTEERIDNQLNDIFAFHFAYDLIQISDHNWRNGPLITALNQLYYYQYVYTAATHAEAVARQGVIENIRVEANRLMGYLMDVDIYRRGSFIRQYLINVLRFPLKPEQLMEYRDLINREVPLFQVFINGDFLARQSLANWNADSALARHHAMYTGGRVAEDTRDLMYEAALEDVQPTGNKPRNIIDTRKMVEEIDSLLAEFKNKKPSDGIDTKGKQMTPQEKWGAPRQSNKKPRKRRGRYNPYSITHIDDGSSSDTDDGRKSEDSDNSWSDDEHNKRAQSPSRTDDNPLPLDEKRGQRPRLADKKEDENPPPLSSSDQSDNDSDPKPLRSDPKESDTDPAHKSSLKTKEDTADKGDADKRVTPKKAVTVKEEDTPDQLEAFSEELRALSLEAKEIQELTKLSTAYHNRRQQEARAADRDPSDSKDRGSQFMRSSI